LHAAASDWPSDAEVGAVVVRCGALGARSVLAGPSVHFVDPCALTDAYLASLPFKPEKYDWRIGHFVRQIPEGYVEAIIHGDSEFIKDKDLRERLEKSWKTTRP